MKITKIIGLFLVSGTLIFASSCKKCGYCQTTCNGGSSGGGTQVTKSDTYCSGDYEDAKSACESAFGAGVCSIKWVDK